MRKLLSYYFNLSLIVTLCLFGVLECSIAQELGMRGEVKALGEIVNNMEEPARLEVVEFLGQLEANVYDEAV